MSGKSRLRYKKKNDDYVIGVHYLRTNVVGK